MKFGVLALIGAVSSVVIHNDNGVIKEEQEAYPLSATFVDNEGNESQQTPVKIGDVWVVGKKTGWYKMASMNQKGQQIEARYMRLIWTSLKTTGTKLTELECSTRSRMLRLVSPSHTITTMRVSPGTETSTRLILSPDTLTTTTFE